MEIGDIFVVNKSDKHGADKVRAEIEYMLSLKQDNETGEKKPVIMTSALKDEGIDELVESMDFFIKKISDTGDLERRRKKRIELEIRKILSRKVEEAVHYNLNLENKMKKWVSSVFGKENSVYHIVNSQFGKIIKEQKAK